jgi:hypothetical protein
MYPIAAADNSPAPLPRRGRFKGQPPPGPRPAGPGWQALVEHAQRSNAPCICVDTDGRPPPGKGEDTEYENPELNP